MDGDVKVAAQVATGPFQPSSAVNNARDEGMSEPEKKLHPTNTRRHQPNAFAAPIQETTMAWQWHVAQNAGIMIPCLHPSTGSSLLLDGPRPGATTECHCAACGDEPLRRYGADIKASHRPSLVDLSWAARRPRKAWRVDIPVCWNKLPGAEAASPIRAALIDAPRILQQLWRWYSRGLAATERSKASGGSGV